MSQSHVGHDCQLGNHIIMATGATLAGHVEVGDQAYISGNCVVHQFVRIGRLALMRGLSRASRDVPPYCISDGTHTIRAINRVGLRRAGFTAEQIRAIQRAFHVLFRTRRNLRLAMEELESQPCTDEVRHLLDFIRTSKRGVGAGPRQGAEGEGGET
jgi:UDP-N-acetylglucosamine acyltransferase